MLNWDSLSQADWDKALKKYNDYLTNDEKASRDARVTLINYSIIRKMSAEEFNDFLYKEFFPWKYTAPNRLATTRKSLSKMSVNDIGLIKNFLCSPALSDVQLLDVALKIKGLGPAGATALLSILYPDRFGTLDQFVVKCLQAAPSLSGDHIIRGVNPNSIKKDEALYIIRLMQNKAITLNNAFGTHTWLPRTIDKAVWADR